MAIAGQRPKPPALKIVQGNPGGKPIKATPKPAPLAPRPPVWRHILGNDPEGLRVARDAAAEWRRVVPVLERLGLLSTIDGALLTDYCVCWARLLACERDISEKGMAVLGERGYQKNPSLTAANMYRAAIKNYIAELGLGPSSRGRLTVPEVDDGSESPFDV